MTEITASMVKELRDATSAGMMDAKRALQETDGDFDAAVKLLRERGMASAAKRAGRETTEGIVLTQSDDERGTIVAIGCETEPVSKNDDFRAFAHDVLREVHDRGEASVEVLEERRIDLSGRLGENIQIASVRRMSGGHGESFHSYVHPPAHKIGVLIKTKGGDPGLARQLAMHISFARPTYRSRDEVPSELVAKLGENVTLAGAARFVTVDGSSISAYVHPPANKVGALVNLGGGSPALARALAMHIAWFAPRWISRDAVPEERLAMERDILMS